MGRLALAWGSGDLRFPQNSLSLALAVENGHRLAIVAYIPTRQGGLDMGGLGPERTSALPKPTGLFLQIPSSCESPSQ